MILHLSFHHHYENWSFSVPIFLLTLLIICLHLPTCIPETFNHPVDSLPPSLLNIRFGSQFNQQVNTLPPKLQTIQFGSAFNSPIDCLPPHIQSIQFDLRSLFNKAIDHLPSSLQLLAFSWGAFNQPIAHLPDSLKELRLQGVFNHPIDYLPSSLEKLILSDEYIFNIDYLPSNLKHLELGYHFNLPIDHLPSSLEYIVFSNEFDFQLIIFHLLSNIYTMAILFIQTSPAQKGIFLIVAILMHVLINLLIISHLASRYYHFLTSSVIKLTTSLTLFVILCLDAISIILSITFFHILKYFQELQTSLILILYTTQIHQVYSTRLITCPPPYKSFNYGN